MGLGKVLLNSELGMVDHTFVFHFSIAALPVVCAALIIRVPRERQSWGNAILEIFWQKIFHLCAESHSFLKPGFKVSPPLLSYDQTR